MLDPGTRAFYACVGLSGEVYELALEPSHLGEHPIERLEPLGLGFLARNGRRR